MSVANLVLSAVPAAIRDMRAVALLPKPAVSTALSSLGHCREVLAGGSVKQDSVPEWLWDRSNRYCSFSVHVRLFY